MTILARDMNFQRFPPRDVMLRELRNQEMVLHDHAHSK